MLARLIPALVVAVAVVVALAEIYARVAVFISALGVPL